MPYIAKISTLHRSLRIILTALVLTGCTCPAERLHPRFSNYHRPMKTLLFLPPDIGLFEQMPDGRLLWQETQSLEARQTAQRAITGQLVQRGFRVATDDHMITTPPGRSVTKLFKSVNRAIQLHTFGPQIYPAKLKAFEYRLGSLEDLLSEAHADGLVLAIGHQTGSGEQTKNWLSIAVMEPQGRVIWYAMQGGRQEFDLQNADGITELVAAVMANFREAGS